MSKKPKDALTALVGEVVELKATVTDRFAAEDAARVKATQARQALDDQIVARKNAEQNLERTQEALNLIALRDDIGQEVLDALIQQEEERRR